MSALVEDDQLSNSSAFLPPLPDMPDPQYLTTAVNQQEPQPAGESCGAVPDFTPDHLPMFLDDGFCQSTSKVTAWHDVQTAYALQTDKEGFVLDDSFKPPTRVSDWATVAHTHLQQQEEGSGHHDDTRHLGPQLGSEIEIQEPPRENTYILRGSAFVALPAFRRELTSRIASRLTLSFSDSPLTTKHLHTDGNRPAKRGLAKDFEDDSDDEDDDYEGSRQGCRSCSNECAVM